MKKILSIVLGGLLAASAVFSASAATVDEFSDMPNDWSTPALTAAVENGLLTGSDGLILPKDNLTRAQMATIIVRAFAASSKDDLAGFTDVPASKWYFEYMQKAVEKCVEVLRAGGIILYPTDTVWGIGCDATNEEAVQKIYKLKRSEDKHSMLCLCRDADMIVRYVNRAPGIAFEVMELSDKPLTAILPGAVGVAPSLIPETKTLGVRIPQHEFCQALLRKFGKPIVSTSANISGEETAKRLKDVVQEIIDGVDYVVNPRFEGKPTLKPSSIIAFGEGSEIEIIRQ